MSGGRNLRVSDHVHVPASYEEQAYSTRADCCKGEKDPTVSDPRSRGEVCNSPDLSRVLQLSSTTSARLEGRSELIRER
jgi:hypothetical protein